MVDVTVEGVIARPREDVAAYAGDPDNAPEWYANIDTAEWKTPKPLTIGSKVAFSARFLGRTLAYVYEFVELEPGRRLVMRTSDGPFPMQTTYEWFDQGEGATRMTLNNRGGGTGFFARLGSPFVALMMRAATTKNLKDLATILESR